MDLSQQALQTYGKLFSNFEIFFKLIAENQKKIFKLLDKLYKLMKRFFSNFGILFLIKYKFLKG